MFQPLKSPLQHSPRVRDTLLHFPDLSSHRLESRIRNRRVVLVGPAIPNDPQLRLTPEIDSYDIVVRIKRGFPVPESLQPTVGTRTDYLYTNLRDSQNWVRPRHLERMASTSQAEICYPYPFDSPKILRRLALDENYFHNYDLFMNQPIPPGFTPPDRQIPFHHCFSAKKYREIETSVGTRPTTGLLTLLHLIGFHPASIHLTGFTFRHNASTTFQSELYHPSYKSEAESHESWHRTVKTPVHNIETELAYFRRLLYNLGPSDPRITLDDRLTRIIFEGVNFVMSRMPAVSSFYPLIKRLSSSITSSKYPLSLRLFIHPNPKIGFDPFQPEHISYLQRHLHPLGVDIYHSHFLPRYRGLTFVVEGDMVGWKNWQSGSAQYWSKMIDPHSRFYTISLINCWDFYKNLNRYRSHVDRVAIPEIYREFYNLEGGPQLIPYGNPKFDYPFQQGKGYTTALLEKYGITSTHHSPPSKIALFLYPKTRHWTHPPSPERLHQLVSILRSKGYYVIVKCRAQDPLDVSWQNRLTANYQQQSNNQYEYYHLTQTLDDPDYIGDLVVLRDYHWTPPTTFELMHLASIMIQFSSASVEESVYVGCPVIDCKIDDAHDRFSFLLSRNWVSRIDMLPRLTGEKWQDSIRRFTKALDKDYTQRWEGVDNLNLPRTEIGQTYITKYLQHLVS